MYLLNKQINPEVEMRKGIYMVKPNLITKGRGKNGCSIQERRLVAQRERIYLWGKVEDNSWTHDSGLGGTR